MNNINSPKRRKLLVSTAIVCIIALAVLLYSAKNPNRSILNHNFDTSKDFIEFVDSGQGDSAIIYSNGYCALIDVGLPNAAASLSENLDKYDVTKLNAVVISHLHSDHIGALPQIAELFKIENIIMPKVSKNSIVSAKNGKTIAVKGGAACYDAVQGMNFTIGEFQITLLNSPFYSPDENNGSVFVMAEIDGTKILFTGDAEAEAEAMLLKESLDLDCDILKVGHHGSDSSTTKSFLKLTTPEYAVISVGEDNIYQHPHYKTLKALQNSGAKIYRTDKSGDITFYFDNGQYKIIEEK